jgi:hypothetical protein
MSGENIDLKTNHDSIQPFVRNRLSEKAPTQTPGATTKPTVTKCDEGRSSMTGHDIVDAFSRSHQISSKKLIIEQTFIIRLKSSWSGSKVSGLAKIVFMDGSGTPLEISSDWIACKNCGLAAPKNVHKLIAHSADSLEGEGWPCVLHQDGSELIFDLRKCRSVNSIQIHNLRDKGQGNPYAGIKDIVVMLNGKLIYAGELRRPDSKDVSSDNFVELPVKLEISDGKDSQNYLSKLRSTDSYAQKIYSKTQNFSATQNIGLREGPLDPKNLSPRNAPPSKDVRQSFSNFNIMPSYTLSDDDSHRPDERGSSESKPEDRIEGSSNYQATGQASENQSDRGDVMMRTGRTTTHADRSASKASRDSQDSKLRKHPQIANSSAKYIFTADLGARTRPTAGTASISRPKVNPVTPGRVFTLDDKVGQNKLDYPLSREPSQESSKRIIPRSKMLSTNSSKDLGTPPHNVILRQAFKDLVDSNKGFEIPNLPLGKQLLINLYTNWGHNEQIGFHGVELFDVSGKHIEFPYPESSIARSSGSSKEIHDEPANLKKLIADRHLMANPDLHWTTKLTGKPIQLKIKLPSQTRLSLIRIWNLGSSKSMINSGIRHISIQFDEKLIFLGEVSRCSGDKSLYFHEAEYILFTGNKTIQQNIEQIDWINGQDAILGLLEKGKSIENLSLSPYSDELSPILEREKLPDRIESTPFASKQSSPSSNTNLSKKAMSKESFNFLELTMKTQGRYERSQSNLLKLMPTEKDSTRDVPVTSLDIQILQTWSNSDCFGVRAIEIYGKN